MQNPAKKAILLVTHGMHGANCLHATRASELNCALNWLPNYVSFASFAQRVVLNFSGYDVYWAFKLGQTEQTLKGEPKEKEPRFYAAAKTIAELLSSGFSKILVQPLYIVPGQEFKQLQGQVSELQPNDNAVKIAVGGPLLSSSSAVKYLAQSFWKQHKNSLATNPNQAVIYVGHGSNDAEAGELYFLLEQELQSISKQLFFTSLLHPSAIQATLKTLHRVHINSILLVPFMTNPGAKSLNELAGAENSISARLESMGISCKLLTPGLIENKNAQALWLAHLQKARESFRAVLA